MLCEKKRSKIVEKYGQSKNVNLWINKSHPGWLRCGVIAVVLIGTENLSTFSSFQKETSKMTTKIFNVLAMNSWFDMGLIESKCSVEVDARI